MNNGEYAGPLISRNSPRWRMWEWYHYAPVSASTPPSYFFEPYIPPSVTAVMVSATAGANATTNSSSAASCHNLIFPLKQRRFFVHMDTFVRLYLVHEAELIASTNAAVLPNAEIAVVLTPSHNNGSAVVYSRNTTQFTVNTNSSLSFLNGVIAGGSSNGTTFSFIKPELRQTGSGTSARLVPGNLFWPIRSETSGVTTPGAGSLDNNSAQNGSYIRLEYLL